MPLLDDRGRFFGKVNLIDAAVVAVVLGLIPLGYASWGLFKTPATKLISVSPAQLKPNDANQHLVLNGEGLRPYLRAFVGQGGPSRYLFETPTRSEIVPPALPPGKYDVFLADETQEVTRVPNAFTVIATPPPTIASATPAVLEYTREPQHITLKGERFPPVLKVTVGPVEAGYKAESDTRAELTTPPLPPGTFDIVLSDTVQELVRLPKAITVPKPTIQQLMPATVEATRDSQRIEFSGKHFQPTLRMFVGWREVNPTFVSLEHGEFALPPLPAGRYDVAVFDASGTTELARYPKAVTVRAVESADVTVQVRFVVRPEVLAVVKQMKPGDTVRPGIVFQSLVERETLAPSTRVERREGTLVVVEAQLRVSAQWRADVWQYDGQTLRAGAPFSLKTATFDINGDILGTNRLR